MRSRSSELGFTFIELIIALTILAFISLFVAQSIRSASRNKAKIQGQIDRDSSLRDALQVIARDVRFAFNYRDLNVELYNEAQKQRRERATKKKTTPVKDKEKEKSTEGGKTTVVDAGKPVTTGTTPQVNLEEKYPYKEEKIFTQFQGDGSELHFTSLSNIRSLQDQAVSDQAEVGYFLKSCRSRKDLTKNSQCLWRRVSQILDDKTAEDGTETPLLENVSKLKFRYIGPSNSDQPEWRDDWKSGEGADDFTKGKFPWAVEISVEVLDKSKEKDKPLAMTVVASLRFPNNKDAKDTLTTPPENLPPEEGTQ